MKVCNNLNISISKRLQNFPPSGIRQVFDRLSQVKEAINFSIGQPHFSTPTKLKNLLNEAVIKNFNTYTPSQGLPELIANIEKNIQKTKQVFPQKTMITSGVSGGINLAFQTLLDPGDEIIIPDPYFVMYKQIALLLGAKPVFVPCLADFHLDIEKLKKSITPKTKIIILNSPNNPTGCVYHQTEIAEVIHLATKQGIIIISDEIYERFYYTQNSQYEDRPYLPSAFGRYENVLLLSGFSKSHSITGWRIGYAAGPKKIIEEMIKLQQFTFVCAPSMVQKALVHCYDQEIETEITTQVKSYAQKAEFVFQELKDIFTLTKTAGAFYSFIRCPNHYQIVEFIEKAAEKKVFLIPGNVFSEKNTHFRLSFATDEQTLIKGCNILKQL